MSSISIRITTVMNVVSAFLALSTKNVNQIAVNKSKIKHCILETNSFLTGEFIFILNTDWMGRNN